MSNFRTIDRVTGFLLPPSVDEWLPERHLARFVVEFTAKTKKAEHAEMVRLGIYSGSYRNFLASKREKKPCSKIAYGLRNYDWLANQARQAGLGSEFERRLTELEDAKKQSSDALQGIIRQPIPDLKLEVS